MGLFKEVKKPVIRTAASGGTEVSARRPTYVAKTAPCIHSCPHGVDVRGWLVALPSIRILGAPRRRHLSPHGARLCSTIRFPQFAGACANTHAN